MSLRHEPDRHRFELSLDDETAYVDYRPLADGIVDYSYVYVPPSHRGRGSAGRVLKFAFDHARDAGWKVRPTCGYIAGHFLPRFPQYQVVVEQP